MHISDAATNVPKEGNNAWDLMQLFSCATLSKSQSDKKPMYTCRAKSYDLINSCIERAWNEFVRRRKYSDRRKQPLCGKEGMREYLCKSNCNGTQSNSVRILQIKKSYFSAHFIGTLFQCIVWSNWNKKSTDQQSAQTYTCTLTVYSVRLMDRSWDSTQTTNN